MRARFLLRLAGVLAGLCMLCAGRPAFADFGVDMRMELGAVIGHGPLAARLDPTERIGIDAAITVGPWVVSGGISFLPGRVSAPPAGEAVAVRPTTEAAPDLDAFGWTATARRYLAATPVGASFVGAGYSVMGLTSERIGGGRVGRLGGPKITAGLDFILQARGRRAGFGLSATYQWLVASLDGGGRSTGGYAGIELTLVQGFGLCRKGGSFACGQLR